jgi:hypothetical protein
MTLHQPERPELTVEALVTWLRTQPAEDTYIWQDPAFCMMARYSSEHGSSWGAYSYSKMPYYHAIAETKPHTFGAALKRAEALLALPKPEPLPEIELSPITPRFDVTERYTMAHTPEFEEAVKLVPVSPPLQITEQTEPTTSQ